MIKADLGAAFGAPKPLNTLRDITAGSVKTTARVYIVEVVPKDMCHVVGFARVNGQVFRERLDLKLKSVR